MTDSTHGIHATGSCLCGSVKLSAKVGDTVGACHCDLCRTWGGGPLLAVDGGTDVDIDGAEHITTYDSTPWSQRAFCSRCGTHLYFRVNDSGRYILPAGLFPLDDELTFDHQIFIDKQPSYYCFANDTQKLTGEEFFKQASQNSDGA